MSTADEREQGRLRDDAIETISGLYPPDSEYADTREHGREDLLAALCAEWRSLPVPVLQHMARLQHFRDHRL